MSIEELDGQVSYLFELEIDRLQCIFSHSNEDIKPTDQLCLPQNDASSQYLKQLSKTLDQMNQKLPKPRNGCTCGLKHNFYKGISEGKVAIDFVLEGNAICSKVLEK
ncbi:Hypothetical_protein [Hexamita inflata]|uniref:Hypothetical_protein n=1 Tax=Hexamita inflata TaxID=28002 RepID=A0AA86QBG7_9EUKA|nr:Hypothetical protein HINF_LOCUS37681 [Hexamita inflata]CAI9955981.1 Hypothetical protein HINF_LOCUS43626 [Hexamita inflata]CAI9958101.1 Hypothetical protein HINF_LOCUS45746 [Hexamita inflata]CAI9970339.1 Hypothetical protein HINF_LOCUS57984 [Hexamita inflata]